MKRWHKLLLTALALALCALVVLFRVANITPNRPKPAGIEWESRFNGPANERDNPVAIASDATGNIVVLGNSVVKYEGATGRLLWAQPYGGSALVIDQQGDICVAGSEKNGFRNSPLAPPFSGANHDIVVLKLSGRTSQVLWKKTFDDRHHDVDWATAIAVDPRGNPVIAGFVADDTHFYYYLAKYAAADGALLWEFSSEDAGAVELDHRYLGLQMDSAGNLFIASTRKQTLPDYSFLFRFHVAKFSGASGELLWEQYRQEGPKTSDIVSALALDSDGNALVTGYSRDDRSTTTITAKFSGADGRQMWAAHYAMGRDLSFIKVDQHGDAFVMAGFSSNGNMSFPEYVGHVVKYSGSDGHQIWEQSHVLRLPSTRLSDDGLNINALLDQKGNLVVLWNGWNGKNFDYHLRWFDTANGSTLREETYDGAANDHDLIVAAVNAPDGGLIVTGSSSNCRAWLKWPKEISYRWRTGRDWGDIEYESNYVHQGDPYNYDFVTVKFPPHVP